MLKKHRKYYIGLGLLCILVFTISRMLFSFEEVFQLHTVTEEEALSARAHRCTESGPYLGKSFIVCARSTEDDRYISARLNGYVRYDPYLMEDFLYAANLYNGSYVLDIGSNIGVYSLLSAAHGHSVIAVDPMPSNHAHLFNSKVLNHSFGYLIIQLAYAVSDRYETYYPKQMKYNNPGDTVMVNDENSLALTQGKMNNTVKIRSILLQDILDIVPRSTPAIIKMDIQGFECKALSEFLENEKTHFVPYIMLENTVICKNTNLCPEYKTKFLSGLEKSGYKPYSPEEITYEDLKTKCPFNLFFVHESAKPLPFLPRHDGGYWKEI